MFLRRGVILDFLCGSNVFMRVLLRRSVRHRVIKDNVMIETQREKQI
jgi:hypothetical protein